MYRPKAIDELHTPVKLLIPTFTKYNGVRTAAYPEDGDVIFVNWKGYGGTEREVNGVYSVIDTATVTTWFRPDISSDCRLMREDGTVYRIMQEPENVELRGQFCVFKVERIKGGV